MGSSCIDCLVCDGYETYGGKPCTFCNGTGVHHISNSSLKMYMENAEEYKAFVDEGGDPEEWKDW